MGAVSWVDDEKFLCVVAISRPTLRRITKTTDRFVLGAAVRLALRTLRAEARG